jgi:hypothetical protein
VPPVAYLANQFKQKAKMQVETPDSERNPGDAAADRSAGKVINRSVAAAGKINWRHHSIRNGAIFRFYALFRAKLISVNVKTARLRIKIAVM